MEEIIYKVNFDFEAKLSGLRKSVKGASWFDHIFFFINDNPNAALRSDYNFSIEYLEYLKTLSVKSIKLSNSKDTKDWWSHDDDDSRNKYFNSKIEMSRLGVAQKWIPIQTEIGIDSYDNFKGRVVARSDWGFSGRGTYFIDNKNELSKLRGEFVLSQFVKKYKDYGITFNLANEDFFIIENYIDHLGQFKGGEIVSTDTIGKDNLDTLLKIKESLKNRGALNSIQIDCFSYEDGFHPFVEVNYRRTMGQMIYALSNLTGKKYTSWMIFKNNGKDYKSLKLKDVFITSPIDRFISFCISSDDETDFIKEKNELEKFFS